jgi:uncharacterized membrane protein
MSATGFEMKAPSQPGPKSTSVNRAILFILPSIVVTVVSIILFSQLTSFTQLQQNIFSITIFAAIILSLVGMAGIQVLIYRIIGAESDIANGGASRSVKIGITYSIILSIILATVVSPYFLNVLHFSITDFIYFAALLFLYSSTWALVSAFWASGKYGNTAVIFIFSYLVIFALTYIGYAINPAYAILGFTCGTAVLFMGFLLTSTIVFRRPESSYQSSGDVSSLTKLVSQNSSAIIFNIFYILAIFLDKIIVWGYQGINTGQGLLIAGTYTQGAFLGLIPMLSIAAVAYFARRTQSLVDDRYNGTYSEIQKRIETYKRIYGNSVTAMLLITLGLTGIVAALTFFLTYDFQVLRILLTVSLGSVFFVLIIFNSTVLVIFGKSSVSAYSVMMVIIFELLTIPFVSVNVWFCALGFLTGSFIGFLISSLSINRLFSNYEYNIFSLLLKSNIN